MRRANDNSRMRATCIVKNNMADQNHELACLVFNYASCMHVQIFLFRRACRLLAAHENFFVTNDEKYQTRLIFGLHVTNDENAVKVARTRGNFVDPTCHE